MKEPMIIRARAGKNNVTRGRTTTRDLGFQPAELEEGDREVEVHECQKLHFSQSKKWSTRRCRFTTGDQFTFKVAEPVCVVPG